MRRVLLLTAAYLTVAARLATAGPGSASGPITVDSTTFVAGSSVMGTDGGVFSDALPPVASTTTAAYRMTRYRAQHMNLRDNSGAEIGTVGNPLNVTGQTTVAISTVQVTNSSFSVTGSTVNANVNGTVSASVTNFPATQPVSGTVAVANSSFSVTGSTVVIVNPAGSSLTVNLNNSVPAGSNNIGTVSGSSVTVVNSTTNPVNVKQVNVSTVVIQSMPPVSVSVGTVTVTNSSFSIVGISSVNVVNTPNVNVTNTPAVQVASALPAGGNNIGTVTGSSVSIPSGVSINGTPNVNVAAPVTILSSNPSAVLVSASISGSSNTVQAAQSGAWSVNAIPAGISTVTFNGVSQPTSPTQTNPANLRVSASIMAITLDEIVGLK